MIPAAPTPEPDERPVASEDSLVAGAVLGSVPLATDLATAEAYLAKVGERATMYAEKAIIHPGMLLGGANRVLMANVVLPAWLHVEGAVRHLQGGLGRGGTGGAVSYRRHVRTQRPPVRPLGRRLDGRGRADRRPPSTTRHLATGRRLMLGLPDGVCACLFDLDGVLTQTAKVHAAAWKEMFDSYLRSRADRFGEPFRPFDAHDDYDTYVDGKPRLDGVRDFLASRGIHLPEGSPDDPPTAETLHGLGLRKNEIVLRRIHDDGVEAYPGSVAYVQAVKKAGLRRVVVSSSSNCRDVLKAAGILHLFEESVDGTMAERDHLRGKPAPDTYLAAARHLGVEPAAANGVRRRARRRRSGPGRSLRLRRRCRPGGPGRGPSRPRRRPESYRTWLSCSPTADRDDLPSLLPAPTRGR